MESTQLLPVSRLENAWSRLSSNPDYQRCVKGFFKAPSFYVGCSGLFAGTSKATGTREVYCDRQCCDRLSSELAARVTVWVPQSPPLQLQSESVDDVQALDLQNERDIKALFKDLKRFARLQKQSRQLAAARALLFNVRRWTESLDAARAAPAATLVLGGCPANVPSHAIAPEPSSGSQSADEETEGCGPRPPCDGSCGAPNHQRASAGPESRCGATEEEPPGATGTASASEARACAGIPDEKPVLRALRTTACSDPWVGSPPNFWRSSDLLPSCYSSGAPSNVATPLWPPGTPRFASASAGAASPSTVGGTPLSDSDTELACPSSPGPGRALPDGATGAATPVAEPAAECETVFSGGGAEGVLAVFCSIDLEWWERDNTLVTEVGWTLWDNLTRQLVSRHHIVEEHEALVNRVYVPDHKHDFLFGRSSKGSLKRGAALLQSDLDYYGERVWARWWTQHAEKNGQQQQQPEGSGGQRSGQGTNGQVDSPAGKGWERGREASGNMGVAWNRAWNGGSNGACGAAVAANAAASEWLPLPPPVQLVVVGHGLSQDLKALSSLLGVTIPPTAAIVDTSEVAWGVLEPGPGQERNPMSLRVLLKSLDISATKLHNGGNDARFTMEALLRLAALEPGTSTQVQQA